jgi:ribose 5-phosphate isomerase B
MKKDVITWLHKSGWSVQDFGVFSEESVDYPDVIYPCAEAVGRGDFKRGIVICGSGIGASIVANKAPGVRAALVLLEEHARLSRMHNDANILALSGRHRTAQENLVFLRIWLTTEFEGGRHQRRVDKIGKLGR